MQHFERLKEVGQQAIAFRMLRRGGFSASQTWEILREDEPVDEIEVRLMRKEGWSLHQARQVIHDAMLLGLITGPPEYLAKLNAYLEKHGAFIAEDGATPDSP